MFRIANFTLLLGAAGPAVADPGAHLHPHDGVGWPGVAALLSIVAYVACRTLMPVKTKRQTHR